MGVPALLEQASLRSISFVVARRLVHALAVAPRGFAHPEAGQQDEQGTQRLDAGIGVHAVVLKCILAACRYGGGHGQRRRVAHLEFLVDRAISGCDAFDVADRGNPAVLPVVARKAGGRCRRRYRVDGFLGKTARRRRWDNRLGRIDRRSGFAQGCPRQRADLAVNLQAVEILIRSHCSIGHGAKVRILIDPSETDVGLR